MKNNPKQLKLYKDPSAFADGSLIFVEYEYVFLFPVI